MEIIVGETGRIVENVYFLEWAWGWEEVKQGTAVLLCFSNCVYV